MWDPFGPALNIPVQYGREHPLLRSGMLAVQLCCEFLGILSLGIAIDGAAACDHRKPVLVLESDHIRFVYKHHGTDDGQFHAV